MPLIAASPKKKKKKESKEINEKKMRPLLLSQIPLAG